MEEPKHKNKQRSKYAMAFDAFVKIDGIEGEGTDDKHAGWIEVIACDAKLSQQASSTASSVGGGSI